MIRIFGSLFAPLSLANRGFYLEVAAVIRMYLEQLAWCAKVRWNHKETEDLFEITGEKSIHELKKIYPGVGGFYGILSQIVHHHPDRHIFFRGQQAGRTNTTSLLVSADFRRYSLCYVLLLVDIIGFSAEALYGDELSSLRYINQDGSYKKNRKTLKLYRQVLRKFPEQKVFEVARHFSI